MPLICSSMPKNVSEKGAHSFKTTEIKPINKYKIDIKSLTKPELLELLERENKLINSLVLANLPDKGEKIKKLKQDIEDELVRRNKAQDISDALSQLSINENKIDILEWGEKNNKYQPPNVEVVEDDQNPFTILATHSGTNHNQKKIQTAKEEEPLITLADIEEVYALNLCNKIDKTEPKKKFLPYKTLNSNSFIQNPKLRELSAATPPLPIFGDIKLISLEESLQLQFEQTKHLKEVQIRHATERLKGMRYKIGETLPSGESIKKYRDNIVTQYSEEEEESENENEV